MADLTKAVDLQPSSEIGYVNRGSYWLQARNYDKAVSDYQKALSINPERDSVMNELASIRATAPDAKHRNGSEALALAKRACKIANWENAEYLATLAAAHAETGDFESAIKWQTKAMGIASDEDREEFQDRLDKYQNGQPHRRSNRPSSTDE